MKCICILFFICCIFFSCDTNVFHSEKNHVFSDDNIVATSNKNIFLISNEVKVNSIDLDSLSNRINQYIDFFKTTFPNDDVGDLLANTKFYIADDDELQLDSKEGIVLSSIWLDYYLEGEGCFDTSEYLMFKIISSTLFERQFIDVERSPEMFFDSKFTHAHFYSKMIYSLFRAKYCTIEPIDIKDYTYGVHLNMDRTNQNFSWDYLPFRLHPNIFLEVFSKNKNIKNLISKDLSSMFKIYHHLMKLSVYSRYRFYKSTEIEKIKNSIKNLNSFVEALKTKATYEELVNNIDSNSHEYTSFFEKGDLLDDFVEYTYCHDYEIFDVDRKILISENIELSDGDKAKLLDGFNPNNSLIYLIGDSDGLDKSKYWQDLVITKNSDNKARFSFPLPQDYKLKTIFKEEYSKNPEFKKVVQNANFDNLLSSYKLFLNLLAGNQVDEPVNQRDINSLDDLIDLPSLSRNQDAAREPTLAELFFFLKDIDSNSFLETVKLYEQRYYIRNFLHFRHLLSLTRFSVHNQDFDKRESYFQNKQKLESLVKKPLSPISDAYYLREMENFFKPFSYVVDRLDDFWNYTVPLRLAFYDYYKVNGKSKTCYYGDYKSVNIANTDNFSSLISISTIIPHEVGHHIQASRSINLDYAVPKEMDSIQKQKRRGKKYLLEHFLSKGSYSKMARELEADMYAGFFAGHSEGLNIGLHSSYLKSVLRLLETSFGDAAAGFRSEDFENFKNPHGNVKERSRAYLLGVNLSRLPEYQIQDKQTKMRLHEYFKSIYVKSDYLRNLDLIPSEKHLFEISAH